MMRLPILRVSAVLFCLTVGIWILQFPGEPIRFRVATGAERPAATSDNSQDVTPVPQRLREGSRIVDRVGELRETGGRVAFYPDGETYSLQLLENLALERVARDLDQNPRKWSISGTVTEYRGANYLLLQRAVLKSRGTGNSLPRS